MRVRLRQIRCSPPGTKLKINSSAISRRTSRSASLKSYLRPRGARLENACAKCKPICGSSSSHTDHQNITHRHVLPPFLLGGWRDLDWFKFQGVNRPASSTPREHTAQTQPNFHVNGWTQAHVKLKTSYRRI